MCNFNMLVFNSDITVFQEPLKCDTEEGNELFRDSINFVLWAKRGVQLLCYSLGRKFKVLIHLCNQRKKMKWNLNQNAAFTQTSGFYQKNQNQILPTCCLFFMIVSQMDLVYMLNLNINQSQGLCRIIHWCLFENLLID